ncbi:MAG TPA: TetR/AcrR family transcriptional regulator [Candidatus Limnocylindrales bacterium]|jgi:AcrR family transcriptional regulator|nr:TetR/AcrR family transcriptional regulator [Candidatus Limnocylindrales bacterium]
MVELTRRQAIEDVASDLFREHGYAGTSVRDIARALSVQGASLYAHVTSKEDVLWAIVDRAATRFETAADRAEAEAEAHHPGDPTEAIAALVEAHIDVLTADVDEASVFMNEWRSLGEQRRKQILDRRDAYQARFRRHVEAGIAVGAFMLTDAGIATSAILSAINGVAAWYDPDGRLTADRIADHLVDLVLRMLEGSR